jgi:hypothetical protein
VKLAGKVSVPAEPGDKNGCAANITQKKDGKIMYRLI